MVYNVRQGAADTGGRIGGRKICTLWIIGLPQEDARLISEHHWTVCGRYSRDTRPEETFKLVNVVSTLSATTSMLAVDGVDVQSTRSYTQNQGILEPQL